MKLSTEPLYRKESELNFIGGQNQAFTTLSGQNIGSASICSDTHDPTPLVSAFSCTIKRTQINTKMERNNVTTFIHSQHYEYGIADQSHKY